MKVILSIKPVFVEKILKGEKEFEFRRTIFKERGVKKIIVYASSPISKVIGEFSIDKILHLPIEQLWEQTKEKSGIERDFFESYFAEKDKGYAIKIKNFKQYNDLLDIEETFGTKAPQSFTYIKEQQPIT